MCQENFLVLEVEKGAVPGPEEVWGGLSGGGAAVAYNKVYDFMRSSKSKQGRSGKRKEGEEVE